MRKTFTVYFLIQSTGWFFFSLVAIMSQGSLLGLVLFFLGIIFCTIGGIAILFLINDGNFWKSTAELKEEIKLYRNARKKFERTNPGFNGLEERRDLRDPYLGPEI